MRHSDGLRPFLPQPSAGALVPALAGVLALLAAAGSAAAAGGPSLARRPAVSGAATLGTRLVGSPGTWSGAGRLTFAYRWYRCDTMGRRCRPLRGDGSRTHTTGTSDVGHTLSFTVVATDRQGSTRAFASLVGPIAGTRSALQALTQPVIAGAAVQGSDVHVGTGLWKPKPAAIAYQWLRCNAELRGCSAIRGETSEKHAVAKADLGHSLVAIVQAKAGAVSRAIFSTATAIAVANGGEAAAPSPSSAPAVAEVLQQGHVLSASTGTWSGPGSLAYSYRWYRCDPAGAHCKLLRRATKTTHLLGSRDVGHTLGFAVRATNTGGTTTAFAGLVGPIAAIDAALVSTGPPVLTGSAVPGQTLQVSPGGWSQPPAALSYQWERCNQNGRLCAPIAGATAGSYLVTGDDAGHTLLALVHATAGSAAQDVLSGTTATVQAAATPTAGGPSLSADPTVAGTAQQGAQLTGSPGTWTSSGTISYTYNWFRCDAAGAHCLSIHGATKPTYQESAKDAGHTLGFAVHATDGAGTTTGYASLVGPVAAGDAKLVATAPPAVSGTAVQRQALTVSAGSWNATPASVAYQWERCNANGRLCAAIQGATASSYTVTADDAGHTLVAVVTGTLDTATQAAVSPHTAAVS